MRLTGSGVLALVGLALLGAAGVYLYVKGWPALKKTITETLNPASDQNIVNRGVTSAVSAATGREETLGGAIADQVFRLSHPSFTFTGPTQEKVKPTLSPEPTIDFSAVGGA